MGHVVRCLALADMLKNDFEITFAIQSPSKNTIQLIRSITGNIIELPTTLDYSIDLFNFLKNVNSTDIIILDGYNFKTEYQKKIKEKGCKLVCIDDLHSWHHIADVIINHADSIEKKEYSAENYTKFCLGLNYVLLRKEFLNRSKKRKKTESLKKIFISMGAADINNNTQKFVEALIEIPGITEINVMLGHVNPHLEEIEDLVKLYPAKIKQHFDLSADELAQLLENCDLSICPASSISIESCAIGIVLISGYTADNQIGILDGMVKRNTLINFGDMNLLSKETIKNKFISIFDQTKLFEELIMNQREMIDGRSPERLLEIFKQLN
jgi:UDP-2,4-diacetamido-2,4,6-trideoxy-beta-L-altropyranose hydrolase